ncbi:MAG TPA: ABC transporter permease subunit/CPBP intramembrane protease [Candidatus Hydrogenedentes bacterium]|nr:ABC transporter permease subunit/CPBP intramembrane protease [Candidatus Hydrogenedentota bacterium]HOL76992.1 ABC transporter permease subunit/CPBP intramembrane protease [Candidatus Hydrogenedentota bacterium]HPO85825.1 ABC transporter permease subunit/CPBP intramembrane protease [Candidatus Hydrogenedentota bacterium]
MNATIIWAIFRKEIIDTFRDKRALVAMVAIPLLLYPALFLLVSQVAILQTTAVDKGWSRVAVLGDDMHLVRNWVEVIPKVDLVDMPDPRAALSRGELDVVIVVQTGARKVLQEGGTVEITVEYDATETASQRAATRLLEGLAKEKGRLLQQRLIQANITPEFIVPINVTKKNVASPTKVTGSLLGMIIPMIMVLMVGVGAFYPAVDLTAGEKERGTFETLLSTPVAKVDIVTGKFLAVFSLSMMTALLNLASMTTTFSFQIAQLPGELESALTFQISPYTGVLMALFLVPLAFFISAVMMSLAVFARSFREAQSYVTPFFLVILFPAAAAGVPGMNLNNVTQFLPITNVALLFKEMMKGEASPDATFAVLTSTAAYALLALLAAAWIFQREEIMLADSQGTTMPLRRAYLIPRTSAPVGLALFLYGVSLLLIFYLGTFLQLRSPFWGLLITQWGLLLAPAVLTAWYAKLDFSQTFHLVRPNPSQLLGGFLLSVGWLVLLLHINVWIQEVLPVPEEIEKDMEWMLERIHTSKGALGLYFAAAISPAICEEAVFRGVLLSSLKSYMRPWVVWLLVALLFGILHMNIYRLPATFLSGVVLSYLVWRSRSIFLGFFAHLIINASTLWLHLGPMPAYLRPILVTPLEQGEGLPLKILIPAIGCAFLGIAIMENAGRRFGAASVSNNP